MYQKDIGKRDHIICKGIFYKVHEIIHNVITMNNRNRNYGIKNKNLIMFKADIHFIMLFIFTDLTF